MEPPSIHNGRLLAGVAHFLKHGEFEMCNVNNREQLLESVLAYKHPDLLNRFGNRYFLTDDKCEQIFRELKLWLYLVGTRTSDAPPLVILSPMEVIDNIWHEFLLYTTDYANFCHTYFGHFIHHEPTRVADRLKLQQERECNLQAFQTKRRAELEIFIGYVYDKLGAEVCHRWFSGRVAECRKGTSE